MDTSSLTFPEARTVGHFFRGQLLHLGSLLVLVPIAWAFSARVLGSGSYLGVRDAVWFWLTIGVPILHQILVWLVFRWQLGWGAFTRLFGRFDMTVWGMLFLPFLFARLLLLGGLALSDQGSLLLPEAYSFLLAAALLVPAAYTLYSVIRYFGVARALGGDHFRLEYRQGGFIEEGAFGWTSNAMYALAFLGLWSVALLARSQAALAAALFQHAFIWLHYFGTEAPDIELLYDQA